MEAIALKAPQPVQPHYAVLAERFRDVAREAVPLMHAHGNEIGVDRLPVPLRPALNLYVGMERQNRLLWLSVRTESGVLAGYVMVLFVPCTLFAGREQAVLEWIYLKPEARRRALIQDLLMRVDMEARNRKMVAVIRSVWKRRGGQHPTQLTRWNFLE